VGCLLYSTLFTRYVFCAKVVLVKACKEMYAKKMEANKMAAIPRRNVYQSQRRSICDLLNTFNFPPNTLQLFATNFPDHRTIRYEHAITDGGQFILRSRVTAENQLKLQLIGSWPVLWSFIELHAVGGRAKACPHSYDCDLPEMFESVTDCNFRRQRIESLCSVHLNKLSAVVKSIWSVFVLARLRSLVF
jgi:hypothetical protein